MKIQKKALAAIAEITNELGDQFDELRAEIDRRFGERRSEGEVFRPLPAPQGMDMSRSATSATNRSPISSSRTFSTPLTASTARADGGRLLPHSIGAKRISMF